MLPPSTVLITPLSLRRHWQTPKRETHVAFRGDRTRTGVRNARLQTVERKVLKAGSRRELEVKAGLVVRSKF